VVEYEERVLSFEVAGKIEKVAVARGDQVEPGASIARVEDTLERLARDAKKDDVEVAKADLALVTAGSRREDVAQMAAQVRAAQSTESLLAKALERSRTLHASGSIAQAELDRSVAELDRASYERKALEQRLALLQRGARREEIERAKARVESSASALALADARLARHEVQAMHGGVVLDVHVEGGELAAPGTPVATIADVGHPFVDVFVPEGELAGVKVGAKAQIRTDSSGGPLAGKVEHVATRAEFTPRFLFSEQERPNLVVRVRVRITDPEGRLHAGTPAFARIDR
jgi:HlyD family secretion protein